VVLAGTGYRGIRFLTNRERELRLGMDDPKLVAQTKAAVLQAMQRFALEQSVEASVNVNPESESRQVCASCGSANRKGNSFCANCGTALPKASAEPEAASSGPKIAPEVPGEHHYHHHYHHHYFSNGGGGELAAAADSRPGAGAAARDVARVRAPQGASLSRAEMALRKLTQDWALACNTKQLDDLIELYVPDATVLRPNVPAVRGTAAIREFFFGLLDAGMSEVELEPVRAELFGDFGYEAGRCKSLVPSAVGKRREERGKYLILLNRQANGEWRIVADSWSSDLSLGVGSESLAKPGIPLGKPIVGPPPRKP
jgi:ketosteroid isomerase-like protein